MGNDESWEAQRISINKTLDGLETTLKTLDCRSNKIVTEIAVIKVKMGMIATGITIFVSAIMNIIIYLIKGGL